MSNFKHDLSSQSYRDPMKRKCANLLNENINVRIMNNDSTNLVLNYRLHASYEKKLHYGSTNAWCKYSKILLIKDWCRWMNELIFEYKIIPFSHNIESLWWWHYGLIFYEHDVNCTYEKFRKNCSSNCQVKK